MKRKKLLTEFVPGRGYTKEDWDEVSDFPESTDEELAQFRPFAEVFPDLAESIRRAREEKAAPRRRASLPLDADVLERLRATGPGWQARANAILRAAAKDLP